MAYVRYTYEDMAMGWDGIQKHFDSVKDYAEQELGYPEGSKWKLLERSFRGNEIYSLITDGTDIMITIDKVKLQGGYWMHKSFTEKDHPYLYNCPKKYIKKSTIMTEWAVNYKAECLKQQHQKKIKADFINNLEAGTVVKTTHGEAVFLNKHKVSQFIGREVNSGKLYRYNINSIIIEVVDK